MARTSAWKVIEPYIAPPSSDWELSHLGRSNETSCWTYASSHEEILCDSISLCLTLDMRNKHLTGITSCRLTNCRVWEEGTLAVCTLVGGVGRSPLLAAAALDSPDQLSALAQSWSTIALETLAAVRLIAAKSEGFKPTDSLGRRPLRNWQILDPDNKAIMRGSNIATLEAFDPLRLKWRENWPSNAKPIRDIHVEVNIDHGTGEMTYTSSQSNE